MSIPFVVDMSYILSFLLMFSTYLAALHLLEVLVCKVCMIFFFFVHVGTGTSMSICLV